MKREEGIIQPNLLNIILADDDKDDCFLFQEALKELRFTVNIINVTNGVQLMQLLSKENQQAYHVLFLDLNMPKKSGFTCLDEIKSTSNFKHLPVIIFSTSQQAESVEYLYKKGADFYIRKPSSFLQLKNVIKQALMLIANKSNVQTSRENFIISSSLELNSPS